MDGTQTRQRERDKLAGALLKEWREERGLSREELPQAMLRAGVPRRNIPSVKTVYNVEVRGQIPRVRLKFGFAQFYGVRLAAIWGAS